MKKNKENFLEDSQKFIGKFGKLPYTYNKSIENH